MSDHLQLNILHIEHVFILLQWKHIISLNRIRSEETKIKILLGQAYWTESRSTGFGRALNGICLRDAPNIDFVKGQVDQLVKSRGAFCVNCIIRFLKECLTKKDLAERPPSFEILCRVQMSDSEGILPNVGKSIGTVHVVKGGKMHRATIATLVPTKGHHKGKATRTEHKRGIFTTDKNTSLQRCGPWNHVLRGQCAFRFGKWCSGKGIADFVKAKMTCKRVI
mmetsp:Transcript_11146/g.34176  ORF Transcript_11146/g.34176 Transcript_11146/m.34176 type:complete len:223 (+) Transcript_11146:1339-2007(+)